MTTRYRVEYALKTHRRDAFIEWIKGLLAVPFVLCTQPAAGLDAEDDTPHSSDNARRRYVEIMSDVENLIIDHISHQGDPTSSPSKLKMLVPSIGVFHTRLCLKDAFVFQDIKRKISSRRFVAPSFNDVRLILNTAQAISLVRNGPLKMMTFDGDLTLYPDGHCLEPQNPVIPYMINLMERGVKIAIVTAAGYTEAKGYYDRLAGLLDAVHASDLTLSNKQGLVVMGGESNFLLRFDESSQHRLARVPPEEWHLPEMQSWTESAVSDLLDVAQAALVRCIKTMDLPAQMIRKARAVGIIPRPGERLAREQLEETVLIVQKTLVSLQTLVCPPELKLLKDLSAPGQKLPFCAFNGGNDVFVDIGDKAIGVKACQKFFGDISGANSLHVGDQFLSAGSNDFKARTACCTAWIASPTETVELLREYEELQTSQGFVGKSLKV